MTEFFHILLTKPLLNILIWFYNVIPGQDMGLAIIALTILIRLILFPSFQKSLRSQRELQKLQPKLNEIKEKYKDDKEAQTKATLNFYKENKVNLFFSCLRFLVQLPILIALYQVFLTGLNGEVSNKLYPFVSDPGIINTNFLGFVELGKSNFWFALAAGIFQFVQSKMIAPPKTNTSDKTSLIMNAQLTYFMPVVTVLISMRLPAGLALYWAVTTLFAIGQQYYIMRAAKT